MIYMNRKGFTLIELLAVIVVLGLVLVVTIPSVIGNIRNNKISSLHTLSKEYAKWYDRISVEDKLSTDKELVEIKDDSWHCIKDIDTSNSYGLSDKNIKLYGDVTNIAVDDNTGEINITENMCSAIRLVDGKAEVLLIAAEGGEFDTNSSVGTYALSSASKGYNE